MKNKTGIFIHSVFKSVAQKTDDPNTHNGNAGRFGWRFGSILRTAPAAAKGDPKFA